MDLQGILQLNRNSALIVGDPDPVRGGLQGQFRYAPEYLEHPCAFPLDSLHLSLSLETFDADRPRAGVHGVFEDSLPDDWGRRLMVRRHHLGRNEQRVPNLLRLLGNQGLGALSYVEEGRPELKSTGVSCQHLRELTLLVQKFEQEPATVTDNELSLLFQAVHRVVPGLRPLWRTKKEHTWQSLPAPGTGWTW